MAIEQGRQRFTHAVGILADEKDRIKERLLIAYVSQLGHIRPDDDLPEEMVAQFDKLKFSLSDAEMPFGFGEHAAKKIHDMTEEEASDLARTIFSLFLKLHDLAPEQTGA